MERYDWPGNVRELKNALERSLVLCRNEEIAVRDLPEEVVHGSPGLPKSGEGSPDFGLQESNGLTVRSDRIASGQDRAQGTFHCISDVRC